MSNRPAIAVGVDGSEQAFTAASWALDTAARRHMPLHVVHSWSIPLPPVGLGPAPQRQIEKWRDRSHHSAQPSLQYGPLMMMQTALQNTADSARKRPSRWMPSVPIE